jgi:starch-binding outer membrane protein, SusD/RagB family
LVLATDINQKIDRLSTPKEVYDQILLDLSNAMERLPEFVWNQSDPKLAETAKTMPVLWQNNKAMPTNGWVRTLRSQVYLTMAGWPLNTPAENPNLGPQGAEVQALYALAAADAEYVIDNKVLYGYDLEEDYMDVFLYGTQFTQKESIITMYYHRDGRDQILAPQSGRPTSEPGEPYNGWNDYMVERPFFFSYPESYRKEITFTTAWFINKRSRPQDWKNWYDNFLDVNTCFFHPYMAKWRSTAQFPFDSLWVDNTYSERAIHLMRYANVLFNYAEASTRATWSVSPKALDAVNQMRRRAHNNPKNTRFPIQVVSINSPNPAYDLPEGLSVTQFLDSLLMEKSYELVGEPENRWWDLVRLDEVYEVALKVKAQRATTQSTKRGDESLSTSDYLHPHIPNLKEREIPTNRAELHLYQAPLGEILNNPELFKY